MKKGLFALALGTFALGIAEFVIMGILGTLATDFSISNSQAGHLISAYALGVSVGAPGLLLARRYRLQKILLFLAAIIALGNVFTSLAPSYVTMLVARFISGLPHGAYFGVGAIMARHLAGTGKEARAVSMMVAGMTVATVIGVPIGTFLSSHLSWRLTFGLVALGGLSAFFAIRHWVPDTLQLAPISFKGQFRFLKSPAPWLILTGVFLGQMGIYCWYSYVEPTMVSIANFQQSAMTWIMVLAGTGMFLGNLSSGLLADRTNPALTSGLIAGFSIITMILIFFFSYIQWAAVILMIIATAGLFGIGGPLQSLIVKYSKGGEMLGAAGIQIAFNVGNAIAAAIGGLVIAAGYPDNYTALCSIPLLMVSTVALLVLYNKYERQSNQ